MPSALPTREADMSVVQVNFTFLCVRLPLGIVGRRSTLCASDTLSCLGYPVPTAVDERVITAVQLYMLVVRGAPRAARARVGRGCASPDTPLTPHARGLDSRASSEA